eukprot:11970682-Alexandrium_andersonii.AAC.1
MKVLQATGHPAPGARPGLILEFIEAVAGVAGGPDVDFAPWIRWGALLGALRPVTSRGVSPPVLEEARATSEDI